jgi:hypothetical protein
MTSFGHWKSTDFRIMVRCDQHQNRRSERLLRTVPTARLGGAEGATLGIAASAGPHRPRSRLEFLLAPT